MGQIHGNLWPCISHAVCTFPNGKVIIIMYLESTIHEPYFVLQQK